MDRSLTQLIADVRSRLADLGYDLVDLQRRGAGAGVRLQVRIDCLAGEPGRGVTIDECATVSRALEAWLDQSGVLGERYVLEVSSPGIERPIRWREHWERFRGREVHVRVEGRGRFRATIVEVVQGRDAVMLRLADGAEPIEVPLEQVRDATLAVDWSAIGRSRSERTSH